MSPIVQPLHVGAINGCPVRFFPPPLQDGRPDLPWVPLDDLLRPLGLAGRQRMRMLQLQRKEWAYRSYTLATAEGPVVVIPHHNGLGLLSAAAQVVGVDAVEDFKAAARTAVVAQIANLGSRAEAYAFIQAAMSRWDSEGTPT